MLNLSEKAARGQWMKLWQVSKMCSKRLPILSIEPRYLARLRSALDEEGSVRNGQQQASDP
jgi:hypothetical protein